MKTPFQKINLCVFISGRGSNLKAILDACEHPDFPAQITHIVSNKADAGGLQYARDYNIPYIVISHKDYSTKQEFEQALLDALSHGSIDLICLAGFMRILSPYFLEQWGEHIINIHPSLLPKYKGIETHARALTAGESQTGCTVHYVIPEMDAGDIILQRSIQISKKDTPTTLAQKLLVEEHIAYPEAIRMVIEEKFTPVKQVEFNFTGLSQNSQIKYDQQNDKREKIMSHKTALQEAQDTWIAFAMQMKYTLILAAIILILMALFLL